MNNHLISINNVCCRRVNHHCLAFMFKTRFVKHYAVPDGAQMMVNKLQSSFIACHCAGSLESFLIVCSHCFSEFTVVESLMVNNVFCFLVICFRSWPAERWAHPGLWRQTQAYCVISLACSWMGHAEGYTSSPGTLGQIVEMLCSI